MFKNLREFLAYLEENGRLLKVKKEVDTRFDIAAGIRKTSDIDGPALLFENVKGFPNWKTIGGVYATKSLVALALGLPPDADEMTMTRHYMALEGNGIKPRMVATGPVKEVIITGNDVDLARLPVPVYSEKDAGAYLTAGVEIARHTGSDAQNIAIHRRCILSRNTTTLLARGFQHLGRMILAAEHDGKGLGVATVIGGSPGLSLATQLNSPWGSDEMEVAGAIQGCPVDLVKCETIDAMVPADAEIVIEGVTVPGQTVACGPFGEAPGNYLTLTGALGVTTPLVKVTAITMRKDAMFQALLTGMAMTENHAMKKWAIAADAVKEIAGITDVHEVNVSEGGNANSHVIVSIHKRTEAEARNVIYRILSSRLRVRQVTVVDDDIDVFNLRDVEWAMCTRMWADRDVYIFPAAERAPSKLPPNIAGRVGFDCTAPLKDKQWYSKIRVPGVDKVDYI